MSKISRDSVKRKIDWDAMDEPWDGELGFPDPRLRHVYRTISRNDHTDPRDPFEQTEEVEWNESFPTFEEAYEAYKTRIEIPEVKECDIQMHINFGASIRMMPEFAMPSFGETYVWLARWREDGAFMESYHINEGKFGERYTDRFTNELPSPGGNPGLRSHWKRRHEAHEADKKRARLSKGEEK